MSESVLIIFVSFFLAIATSVVGALINRRATFARAGADSSEAAESLSESARNIIQTYEASVVNPLRGRIDELQQQMSVIEQDRYDERLKFQTDIATLQGQVARLNNQVTFMRGELLRSDTALENAVSVARASYPNEMDRAIRIRRGQE